jgi:hypothetical protein
LNAVGQSAVSIEVRTGTCLSIDDGKTVQHGRFSERPLLFASVACSVDSTLRAASAISDNSVDRAFANAIRKPSVRIKASPLNSFRAATHHTAPAAKKIVDIEKIFAALVIDFAQRTAMSVQFVRDRRGAFREKTQRRR